MLAKLLGKDVEKAVSKEPHLIVVVTYLISKWVEKHHPETQYSLVSKKGLNFVKKHADNFEQLSGLYDKYLK